MEISKEKQIEDMAVIIEQANKQAIKNPGQMKILGQDWFGKWYASALYEAGCRMQSEGEWLQVNTPLYQPIYSKCSLCGIRRNIETQEAWNFCPNCGADMRGGE